MVTLQTIFQSVLNPLVPYSNKIQDKMKNKIIIASVFILNFLCNTSNVLGNHRKYYSYILFIGIICILIWMFLLLENKLQLIKWDKVLFMLLFIFCASMIVSDFFVWKKVQYHTGEVLLFLFMPFYFVWNNSKRKDKFIQSFISGTQLYFFVAFLWCLAYRPFNEQLRYNFSFKNPNTLGLYCLAIFVICIVSIDDRINQRKKLITYAGDFILIGICVWLGLASEARTSLLTMSAVGIVWLGIIVRRLVIKKKHQVLRVLFVMFMSIGFSILLCEGTFNITARIVKNPVEFKGDVVNRRRYPNLISIFEKFTYKNEQDEEVDSTYLVKKNQGFSILSTRFSEDIREKIDYYMYSSGRNIIYKEYGRNINLLGHSERKLEINGRMTVHSHNNIIQFGYDYGIICLLSYLILMLYIIKKVYGYFKKYYGKRRYSVMPMTTTLVFFIASQTEYLGIIFQHVIILLFLLVLGQIMQDETSEDISNKKLTVVRE